MSDIDPLPGPPHDPAVEVTDAPTTTRRSTAPIWIGLVVLIAILGVAALALSAPDADDAAPTAAEPTASAEVSIDGPARGTSVPQGSPIPAWTAPTLDGSTFSWSERPAGPMVLAIWAPWCPHCQAELPRLSAAIEAHPGVSLVTIATAVGQGDGPTPQEYMESEGLDFTVALDDDEGTLGAALGVQGFPTTYFVDADGLVLASAAGELDPAALDEVLTYLEGPQAA